MSSAHGVLTKINVDGTVTSSRGKVYWLANKSAEPFRAVPEMTFAQPTASALVVETHDLYVSVSQPFCFELPTGIFDVISAEPTGELADMYRGYVHNTIMPMVRGVADTLRRHAAHVEFPPKEWLENTFPEINWRSNTNAYLLQCWLTYVSSYERAMAEWNNGNFTSLRPNTVLPFAGLQRTMMWSQEKAQQRQVDLIGMTSVAELKSDEVQLFSRIKANENTGYDNDEAH